MSKSILKGAMIITFFSMVSKAIGIFFRIPITYILEDVGIGIYYFPVQFFGPILAITTAPSIAIARLISDEHDDYLQYHIFETSRSYMLLYGLVISIIMGLLAPLLIKTIWTEDMLFSYLSLIPAPIFLAVSSSYKGYHQGCQKMNPIAALQFSDGLGRLIIGLFLTIIFMQFGVQYAAAGAAFGTTAGAIVGLITIVSLTKSTGHSLFKHDKIVLKSLVTLSLPIIISALGINLMNFVDGILIKSRLGYLGYDHYEIFRFSGILSSVNTLTSIPVAIGIAINLNALPNITAAAKHGALYVHQRMRSAMIMIISIALPSAVGLYLVGNDIFKYLYPSINADHYLIEIYSVSIVFLIINLGLTTILQARKKEKIPVRHMYIGIVFKLILSYILLGMKDVNIHGTAISTTIAYGIVMILNLYSLIKSDFDIDFKYMIMIPLFSSVTMGILVWLVNQLGSSIVITILSIFIGTSYYGMLMIVFKVVAIKDVPLLKRIIS